MLMDAAAAAAVVGSKMKSGHARTADNAMGRKETFVSHCALIHCLQRRQTWIDATPDNMNFQRKPDCNLTRRECNKKETNTVQEI